MRILAIIPARGGSKGLPGKNIKPLNGKPLIYYSIDIARSIVPDCDICVTTDDSCIIETAEQYGLKVPFVRPAELASDTATTNDVLIHALDYYKTKGEVYDVILLLQPTSPLRTEKQIKEAISLYSEDYDMVVSVNESHSSSVLCNVDSDGFLVSTLTNAQRRQDAPVYYEYNGAIYVINVCALRAKGLSLFNRKKPYIMSATTSIDIDNIVDFKLCELLITNGSM